ncbi:MAG TPA: hypothetical protein VFW65_32080 [Pseudonocardiaceae bacterium]|nr:hypothetical protein [Pseudonocardiaceae bacterium]
MTGPPIGHQIITVIRRTSGPPDRLGVPTQVETRHDVSGCSVQPVGTDEQLSNVDLVVTRWRLYAPADADVVVTDAVIAGGLTYEVDGDPQVWPDIRGQPHHLEAYLRRATG